VADQGSRRVVKFSTALDGTGWQSFAGRAADPFRRPAGIFVSGRFAFVADGNRVVKFSTALDESGWISYGKAGNGTGQFSEAAGILLSSGYLYVTDRINGRLVRLADPMKGAGWRTYGRQAWADLGQFGMVTGLASDGTYIYVVDQYTNRVIKIRPSNLSSVKAYGSYGSATGRFHSPSGIAVGAASTGPKPPDQAKAVFVADTGNHRIVRFGTSLSGSDWKAYGAQGCGTGQFANPWGIAVRGRYVYVADAGCNRIVRLSVTLDGADWKTYGTLGSGDGQFKTPHGIAAFGDYLYIADTANNRLVRMNADMAGGGWSTYAHLGSGAGQLLMPEGIAADSMHVYVVDAGAGKILRLARSDFAFSAEAGSLGSANGQFNLPMGIYSNGANLFIGDGSWGRAGNHRVVKWVV
jgi:DNA-binding beta-propeller fold protein YncE